MKTLLILLVAIACASAVFTRYVNLKGKLQCGNNYDYRDTLIELWERDNVDPDDKLKVIKPRFDGSFNITGEETEVGEIQFFLKITHRCLLIDRKDCPSLVDEFDIESSSDPKTITIWEKSLVSGKQLHETPKYCLTG